MLFFIVLTTKSALTAVKVLPQTFTISALLAINTISLVEDFDHTLFYFAAYSFVNLQKTKNPFAGAIGSRNNNIAFARRLRGINISLFPFFGKLRIVFRIPAAFGFSGAGLAAFFSALRGDPAVQFRIYFLQKIQIRKFLTQKMMM